jgi:hypothetical protein
MWFGLYALNAQGAQRGEAAAGKKAHTTAGAQMVLLLLMYVVCFI